MVGPVKVRVIDEKCQAHGLCALVAPDLYKLNADGYAFVEIELVPKELHDKAMRGAAACPEKAIELYD
jgi:ferredoxin